LNGTRRRWSVLLGVFVLFALGATAPAMGMTNEGGSSTPWIASDKSDYDPGGLVTLTGGNWAPSESVHVNVNDDVGQSWSRDVDVTADQNGNITDSFNLPDWFVATYSVKATGASGAVATTTFTDGTVRVRTDGTGGLVTSPQAPISWVHYNNTTCDPGAANANVLASGSFNAEPTGNGTTVAVGATPINVQAGESLRLTAGALTGFNFSSWSNGNFTTGTFTPTSNPGCLEGTNGTQNTRVTYAVVTDTTPPVITANVVGTLGNNGWYTSNVSLTWTVVDSESTVTSTTGCGATSIIADQNATTYTCSATSGGGTSSESVTIKRDATDPTAATTLDRAPDHNDWYNAPVGWTTTGTDVGGSGIDSCSSGTYSGPDGTGLTVSGSCTDNAGNNSGPAASAAFKYDNTDPTAATTLDRAPDHNDWYNAPVGWTTTGTDVGGSGIDSCSSGTYSGPDGSGLTVSGSCTDNAGNSSGPAASAPFKYDNTDPVVTATPSRAADSNGWYNHAFSVSYSGTDATSLIDTCSADSNYGGPDTASGSVGGNCTDNAGNSANTAYAFKYDATPPVVTCQSPAPVFMLGQAGAQVSATVGDGLSGPVTTPVSGAADTSNPAGGTVSLTGHDKAGNSTTVSCAYHIASVVFGKPIEAPMVMNIAKLGRVVPVKVTLKYDDVVVGPGGLPVYVSGLSQVNCATAEATDAVDQYAAAGSSNAGNQFRWDVTGSFWIYNFDTSAFSMKVGNCYRVNVHYGGTVAGTGVASGGSLAGYFLMQTTK
jgi:hypothetical protein